MLLAGLAIVTAIPLAVTWIVSSGMKVGWRRTFLKWLPVAVLWVPVPLGLDQPPFPAGIAFIAIFDGEEGVLLKVVLSEIVGLAALALLAVTLNSKGKVAREEDDVEPPSQ